MNPTNEQLDAVRTFGYTEREARFLYLVATHSGHFLRRQFNAFTGAGLGKAADSFLDKARALRHIHETPYARTSGRRYHLYARGFYAAIGKEHSSNRKAGSDTKANVKLLALDYVLAHRDATYLEEETDKVAYFCDTLGVPKDCLPTTVYEAKSGTTTSCTRYFVDKFPLHVGEGEGGPSVTFTYIDQGVISVGSFRTHLRRYRPLLERLSVPFRVVFAADTTAYFGRAAGIFDAVLAGDGDSREALLRYFRLRNAWEERRFKEFTPEDYVARAQGQKRYATPEHERLYQRWRVEGDLALSGFGSPKLTHGQFATFLLES